MEPRGDARDMALRLQWTDWLLQAEIRQPKPSKTVSQVGQWLRISLPMQETWVQCRPLRPSPQHAERRPPLQLDPKGPELQLSRPQGLESSGHPQRQTALHPGTASCGHFEDKGIA